MVGCGEMIGIGRRRPVTERRMRPRRVVVSDAGSDELPSLVEIKALHPVAGPGRAHLGSTASTGSIARRDWLCANAEVAARRWATGRPFSSRPSQMRAGRSTLSTISSPAAGASADDEAWQVHGRFALQPLSFEGQTGLNVAVGIAGLELRYAGGRLHKKARRLH